MTTRKQRARLVQQVLDQYFPHPAIPLIHTDSYTLLVAVVLSARSTDAQVNRVTPQLFARAATPAQMVALEEEEIRALIRPCGLSPQKAYALKALSQQLLDHYGGCVPPSFEALEALPGVGHKTASVVMAQAFHIPAFPVDTHIYRNAHRWGLSAQKSLRGVEEDLKQLFPKKDWITLHLQIIHFSRTFCPARGHHIEACPICSVLSSGHH